MQYTVLCIQYSMSDHHVWDILCGPDERSCDWCGTVDTPPSHPHYLPWPLDAQEVQYRATESDHHCTTASLFLQETHNSILLPPPDGVWINNINMPYSTTIRYTLNDTTTTTATLMGQKSLILCLENCCWEYIITLFSTRAAQIIATSGMCVELCSFVDCTVTTKVSVMFMLYCYYLVSTYIYLPHGMNQVCVTRLLGY